jgi:hypothetical protein
MSFAVYKQTRLDPGVSWENDYEDMEPMDLFPNENQANKYKKGLPKVAPLSRYIIVEEEV